MEQCSCESCNEIRTGKNKFVCHLCNRGYKSETWYIKHYDNQEHVNNETKENNKIKVQSKTRSYESTQDSKENNRIKVQLKTRSSESTQDSKENNRIKVQLKTRSSESTQDSNEELKSAYSTDQVEQLQKQNEQLQKQNALLQRQNEILQQQHQEQEQLLIDKLNEQMEIIKLLKQRTENEQITIEPEKIIVKPTMKTLIKKKDDQNEKIEIIITKSGRGFWVNGNTKQMKDNMKNMGGSWNSTRKMWIFKLKDLDMVMNYFNINKDNIKYE
jgi:hypothetical protein